MKDKETLEKMLEIRNDIMTARNFIADVEVYVDKAQFRLAILYDEIENPKV